MLWNCKNFKITKFNNEEDYKNGIISTIETHHKNLITNNGLEALFILALGGTYESKTVNKLSIETSKIAIGSGTQNASSTDTSLVSPLDNGLLDITNISIITDNNSSTLKLTAEAIAGQCVGSWNEWGIYNEENGILINHRVESMGTKTATSIWKIEVEISLSGSN